MNKNNVKKREGLGRKKEKQRNKTAKENGIKKIWQDTNAKNKIKVKENEKEKEKNK